MIAAADASAPDGGEVDLLLFRIGQRTYATDAASVLRVDRATETAYALPSLGRLDSGGRVLAFRGVDDERQLRIDGLLGVVRAEVAALRRMPSAAGARGYALGFWLRDGNTPVPLIDLLATSSE